MGKLGWGEVAVIVILALIVLGPETLPKAGRALGQAIRSVKKYVHETTRELEDIDELRELKKDVEDIQKDVRDLGKSIEQSVTEIEEKPKQTEAGLETTAEKASETTDPADTTTQEGTENG